jgi:hypothetical protein
MCDIQDEYILLFRVNYVKDPVTTDSIPINGFKFALQTFYVRPKERTIPQPRVNIFLEFRIISFIGRRLYLFLKSQRLSYLKITQQYGIYLL